MEDLKLKVSDLTDHFDPSQFKFETTEDLTPMQGILGQERANEALTFGLAVNQKGYNIYVSGQWGTGRNSFVNMLTKKQAVKEKAPKDWLYVNNFKNTHEPIAISLENGEGKGFIEAMNRALLFIRKGVPELFSSKDYEHARQNVIKAYEEEAKQLLTTLNEYGKKYGFQFSQSDKGIVSVPLKDGEPMNEAQYGQITPEEYEAIVKQSQKLSIETIEIFNQLKLEDEKLRENLDLLDEEMGKNLVNFQLKGLRDKYHDNADVMGYFNLFEEDVIQHIDQFKDNEGDETSQNPLLAFQKPSDPESFFERYKINLFVDNSEVNSAPVIFESNPAYFNLVGNIEYKFEMGTTITDYTMIKPGALHKANGGYLILLAKDILSNVYAWTSLKRALLDEKVSIDSRLTSSGAVISHSISPQPIPLDVKIIVIGDPQIYYLLNSYDEEFQKLFKIMADFDMEMEKTPENIKKFTRFIATKCAMDNLRPFDPIAVARVIDYANRLSGDKDKLTAHLRSISDIVTEANAWAENANDDVVKKEHIENALRHGRYRDSKYSDKIMELFKDGTYLIDIDGFKIGEINGLAVIGTDQYAFGKPSKITVSTYYGRQGIVNIEREARTSGKIHDKGVMILTGYLGSLFAQDKPLALTANIVFEQLYSGVDGDSASSTELYALLSSLSDVPINQAIAVTGSVNQRGQIQPIGGINEKIEGYFEVCKIKGLTGNQGVMMPKQNVKNLMLNDEVVKAVSDGLFSIYAIETIDQGIEILTGVKAGQKNKYGNYPRGTVYYKVNKRLKELAGYNQEESINK